LNGQQRARSRAASYSDERNADPMAMPTQSENQDKKPKKIEITIDAEPYEVEDKKMTAAEVIAVAGLDPATHYLVEVKNRKQISYKDRSDAEIKLNMGDEFLTVPIGDTTVS
jgi:hypothetical protein